MFSNQRLAAVALGAVLLAGGAWLCWRHAQAAAGRGAARRIAILPIQNLTGREALDWAGGAVVEVAQLELGAGQTAAVFPARDAGEAAARQATDLAYGTLELDESSKRPGAPPLRYAFFLENAAGHRILSAARGTGTALQAATALATLLAPASGVRSLRPEGVHEDRGLELFFKHEYEPCASADPQAYWCWERWARTRV